MHRVLIITNDFPPRSGGIQSFIHGLALRLPQDQVVVYAPAWKGAAEFDKALPFPVVRHPTSLMLPLPDVRRRTCRLLHSSGCDTVLFGAAAPLGLLAPALRKAGARRIIAITHGHEAAWAALPGARQVLRRIGDSVDVVTYLGDYFRSRLAQALSGSAVSRMIQLAAGVDTETFRPQSGGAALRERIGAGDRPIILCVSRLVTRKGQDRLIQALPQLGSAGRAAPLLLLVGTGPDEGKLRRLAQKLDVAGSVMFAGEVAADELPAYYDAATIFAMPCRTRRGGLDVEGLGIVYLEAAASGLPVIAGDSGGAPNAVIDGKTGYVIPGVDLVMLTARLHQLLGDPAAARAMGRSGRAWMERAWRWELVAKRLQDIIDHE